MPDHEDPGDCDDSYPALRNAAEALLSSLKKADAWRKLPPYENGEIDPPRRW